jgi:hypothetical protein
MVLRLVGILAVLASSCGAAVAQQAALDQIYGNGVHAYFAGDHTAATDQLTAAIDGGMKDARAYYFRGLAQARMGHGVQADDDFAQGAALEAAEPDLTPMVSRALQRIQGHTRLKLESYRTKARFAALQQQRARDQARYGKERADERRSLSKQAEKAAPADEGLFDEKAAPADEKKAEEKAPADATEEAPAAKKAEAAPADATDPFGDEPKAAEKEVPAVKEDAPVAKEEAPAAEEMPAEEAAPKVEAPGAEKPAEKKA